ncbi:hypothetical protein EJ110_NYTH37131 [Nymphaea thermarum]|nr:hypothetical protein EJ110_NYTH37131 [Nymphaea thermarum]
MKPRAVRAAGSTDSLQSSIKNDGSGMPSDSRFINETSFRGGEFHPNLRTPKMELPKFSGEDPLSWVFHAEQYFDCLSVSLENRESHAAVHVAGPAIRWYRWRLIQQGKPTWLEFVAALTVCFGPSAYLDYNVELSKIRHKGIVTEYQAEFEDKRNMVHGWPKEALIGVFIVGLRDELRINVQAARPQPLLEKK